LKQILSIDPDMVVIAMTAYGDVNIAVHAIKEGAVDFVLKPWDNDKLLATVSSAMQLRESRKEVAKKQTEVVHSKCASLQNAVVKAIHEAYASMCI
jgi:FixJ family two-component response regulator